MKCYFCGKSDDNQKLEFSFEEINVGGPNDGCVEFADEFHLVPICCNCDNNTEFLE